MIFSFQPQPAAYDHRWVLERRSAGKWIYFLTTVGCITTDALPIFLSISCSICPYLMNKTPQYLISPPLGRISSPDLERRCWFLYHLFHTNRSKKSWGSPLSESRTTSSAKSRDLIPRPPHQMPSLQFLKFLLKFCQLRLWTESQRAVLAESNPHWKQIQVALMLLVQGLDCRYPGFDTP